jgi:hypothetical protein
MDLGVFSCKTLTDAEETASLTAEAVMIAHCARLYGRAPSDNLDAVEYNVMSWSAWADAREANGDAIIQASWRLGESPPVQESIFTQTGDAPDPGFSGTGMYAVD